jgi:plasmid rolling circle replication initiator protein Rep
MLGNKKPLKDQALHGESQKGYSELNSFDDRLNRYSEAKSRQLRILYHLNKKSNLNTDCFIDSEKLSNQLCSCGNYLVFNQYYTVGQVRLKKASFCKNHLLCQLCAIRRGSKQVQAYSQRYEQLNQAGDHLKPYLITLTVKNGKDLRERFSHLKTSFRSYMDRRRDSLKRGTGLNELSKVEGAVFSYEVTRSKDGTWHPHLHMVVLLNPKNLIDFPKAPNKISDNDFSKLSVVDKKKRKAAWKEHTSKCAASKLSLEWLSITKDSSIVDCREIEGDPIKGFIEVFKYALKFSDMKPEDNIYAYSVLKGSRLTGSFGCFWGVKIPEKMTDDLLDDLPYIELFYNYTKNGYSLKSAVPSDSDSMIQDDLKLCQDLGFTNFVERKQASFKGSIDWKSIFNRDVNVHVHVNSFTPHHITSDLSNILILRDKHQLGTKSWFELDYYFRLKRADLLRRESLKLE